MTSDFISRSASLRCVSRLALSVVLGSVALLVPSGRAVAQQAGSVPEFVISTPEPGPQQPPANNWFNVSTPGVAALAKPGSFAPYEPPPAGVCCPGEKHGCFARRLLAWATYCPKQRVCSCTSCCNSCRYKGVMPLYPIFLNPKCFCGSGQHQTVPNTCYRGCQNCAACQAGGHP